MASETQLPSSGDSSVTETPRDLSADKEAAIHYASLSEIPKRKPVPVVTSAPVDDHPTPRARISLLYANLLSLYRGLDKRKRRLAIGLAFVAVAAFLGLIIGLSVGLTVGKKGGPQNLPLPTGNGGPYTGDLTYYTPALGSCGITSSNADSICAVSHVLYDAVSTGSNPNANPLCGLKLRLKRDGKTVDVTVVDRCVGCKATDIDVSMSVFEQLAPVEAGRVPVEWAWIDEAPAGILRM